MFEHWTRYFFTLVFLLVTSATVASQKDLSQRGDRAAFNLKAGGVYVMTNQIANAVIAFARNPSTGELVEVGTFPTMGAGDPIPIPPDPPVDPLASQGALLIDDDHDYLYAVNAGSNEISVMRIGKTGLSFVQKIGSGGVRPISLTISDDLLYVLNEGGTPNITGFTVADDGTLTALTGSTRTLIGGGMADPAQVGFNGDGTVIIVTEKAGNRINSWTIDSNGLPIMRIGTPSAGMTPFGFAFTSNDHLIVSEAFGGAPGASAVSSYDGMTASLSLISGSVTNGQTAACWVVVTNSGRRAFVSNTASGTISSYSIDDGGALSLIDADAANTGVGSAPIDMALSNNNRFLYVLENGDHVVSAWSAGKGGLTSIGSYGMLPVGSQGIAAK